MYNRDFKAAVKLFLDAVSTFTSTELMSYDEFVRYTVYMAIVTLPRVDIKARPHVLHYQKTQHTKTLHRKLNTF